jgi:membrane-associated phospholipid phosphatase
MLGRLPRGCAVLVGAWLVVVMVLVLCGEGVKHSAVITSADRRITTFAVTHRTPALNDIMKVVTWTGSWIAVAVVSVAVGVLTWRRRLPSLALGAVLASWVGELLGVTLVKRLVERDRPPEAVWAVVAHGWAFPSGHTANAVVVFATAAALVARFTTDRVVRVLCWPAGDSGRCARRQR